LPRTRKVSATPTPEPSPSRTVVSYPPGTWFERLKEELVMAGVEHDRANLIARRVLTALVPQAARLEAMDHRGESFRID
jgi:hypothetical protein